MHTEIKFQTTDKNKVTISLIIYPLVDTIRGQEGGKTLEDYTRLGLPMPAGKAD